MGASTSKPDLTLLYSQLGLRPGCSLAELQLAYRRRISQLRAPRVHLSADATQSDESAATLRTLVSLYTTATRFHRRYGRLPGARPGARMAAQSVSTAHFVSPARPSQDPPSTRAAQGLLGFSVVLLLVLLGLLTWWEWFAER